ncbi:MAG: hypothetical protein U1B78_03275, partial [Dehalococcoidia bacterium]|nr:hypothetical protein [Dehalococcoidia bacterium]
MAAAISYYVLFSIIPLTIFTVSVFGFVVRDEGLQQDVSDETVDFLNVEPGAPVIEADENAVRERFDTGAVGEVDAALLELTDDEKEELAGTLDGGGT